MKFSKGQQEIVTTVLIFGVVISLVGATYMWGVPLIQKQQAFANIQRAENFMKDLGKKIENADKTETGFKDIMTITEDGVLKIKSDENVVEFVTHQKGTYYLVSEEGDTKWTPVEWGPVQNGIFGEDKPYIIRSKAEESGDGYDITYQIKFRPLLIQRSNNTYLINVTSVTGEETGVTGDQVHIKNIKRDQINETHTQSILQITIP